MIAWVQSLFDTKNEKNNHSINYRTCCPNCFHEYNLDLEYSTTINIKPNLTRDEINNINQNRLNLEKKYQSQINERFGAANDVQPYENKNNHLQNKKQSEPKLKTELDDNDLKFSTMGEYMKEKEFKKKPSSTKTNNKNDIDEKKDDMDDKYNYRNQEFYKSDYYEGKSVNLKTIYNNSSSQKLNGSSSKKLFNNKPNENKTRLITECKNTSRKVRFDDLKTKNKEQELTPEDLAKYKNIILSNDIDGLIKYSKCIIPSLEVIDYALEHSTNLKINKILYDSNSVWSTKSFSLGVKSGDLEKIQFLIEKKAIVELDEESKVETFLNALAYDDIKILDLIKKNGLRLPDDIIQLAIQKKAFKVIQYLIENLGHRFNKYCFEDAVEIGDIQMLEFLLVNKCEWGEISDNTANNIRYNSNVYDWLKANGCPWEIN